MTKLLSIVRWAAQNKWRNAIMFWLVVWIVAAVKNWNHPEAVIWNILAWHP